MIAVARCDLPNRPVPARDSDVPGSAVGLRAIQAIFIRKALLCPPSQPDSAPAESVSPLGYGPGRLAALVAPSWPTSLRH